MYFIGFQHLFLLMQCTGVNSIFVLIKQAKGFDHFTEKIILGIIAGWVFFNYKFGCPRCNAFQHCHTFKTRGLTL